MNKHRFLSLALAFILALSPLTSMNVSATETVSGNDVLETVSGNDVLETASGNDVLETVSGNDVSNTITSLESPKIVMGWNSENEIEISAVEGADGYIYKLYAGQEAPESGEEPILKVETEALSLGVVAAMDEYVEKNKLWGTVGFYLQVSAFADVTVSDGDAVSEKRVESAAAGETYWKSYSMKAPTIQWDGTTATITSNAAGIDVFDYQLSATILMDDGTTETKNVKYGTVAADGDVLILDFSDCMRVKATYTLRAGVTALKEDGSVLQATGMPSASTDVEGIPAKDETKGLTTPVDLKWESSWVASFDAVDFYTGKVFYMLELYCDDTLVRLYNLGTTGEFTTLMDENVIKDVDKSGAYKFRVYARYVDSATNKFVNGEWSEWSEVKNLTLSDKTLDTPSIAWDSENIGRIKLQEVENADWYLFSLGKYNENTGKYVSKTVWCPTANGDLTGFSIPSLLVSLGEGKYRVSVRALSSDPSVYAHSAYAETDVLDTTIYAEQVESALDAVINDTSKTAEEKLEAVKEELGVNSNLDPFQRAMQNDDTVREKLVDLEQQLISENNISTKKEVSEAAKAYVDVDKISMVGAAFSAEKDSTVSLEVDTAAKPVHMDTMNNVKNMVSLSIKLTDGTNEVEKLDMPITIKIPVPVGLGNGNLVIYHYYQGDAKAPVKYSTKDNTLSVKDGMICFTVTEFSTFVFAEEKDSTEGNTTSGDNATSDNDSNLEQTSSTLGVAPKTGDDFTVALPVSLITTLVIAVFLLRRKAY